MHSSLPLSSYIFLVVILQYVQGERTHLNYCLQIAAAISELLCLMILQAIATIKRISTNKNNLWIHTKKSMFLLFVKVLMSMYGNEKDGDSSYK